MVTSFATGRPNEKRDELGSIEVAVVSPEIAPHGERAEQLFGSHRILLPCGTIASREPVRLAASLHQGERGVERGGESMASKAEEILTEIEKVADDIKVRLKLASMDARDVWDEKLEPRLFEARQALHDAKEGSKNALEALQETMKAFRQFAEAL